EVEKVGAGDVQVAVRAENHAERSRQPAAAAGDEGSLESPSPTIVAQNAIQGDAGNVEVELAVVLTVRAEHHTEGVLQSAAAVGDERIHEGPCSLIVAQDAIVILAADQQVAAAGAVPAFQPLDSQSARPPRPLGGPSGAGLAFREATHRSEEGIQEKHAH